MTPDALETFYETLAEAIDAVGPEQRDRFLVKLALLLAAASDDPARMIGSIRDAAMDLDV